MLFFSFYSYDSALARAWKCTWQLHTKCVWNTLSGILVVFDGSSHWITKMKTLSKLLSKNFVLDIVIQCNYTFYTLSFHQNSETFRTWVLEEAAYLLVILHLWFINHSSWVPLWTPPVLSWRSTITNVQAHKFGLDTYPFIFPK